MRHGKFPKEIVKYIEQIEDQSYIYLVSDQMNRGDVATFLKERQIPYLSEKELKAPVRSIMKAIKVVHDHGFLHNDLQPCNVYLQYGRRVENMDAY